MDVQRKRISHDLISNLFYYLFLVLILLVTILSFTLDEIDLLINILTISLIVTSLVLIFYIAVQMLRYNFTIEKKIQLMTLCSTLRRVPFPQSHAIIRMRMLLLPMARKTPFIPNSVKVTRKKARGTEIKPSRSIVSSNPLPG